jgi:hypothetical protein
MSPVPKLGCLCGYIHDLSPIPDEGYVIFPDAAPEIILWPTKEQVDTDERTKAIVRKTGLLYECPHCGRLMWRKQGETEFRIYRPE